MKKIDQNNKTVFIGRFRWIWMSALLLLSYSLAMASSPGDNEITNTITAPEPSAGCTPFSPGEITGNNPSDGTTCTLIGYQWQIRPGNTNWQDIIGATEQNYTPEALLETTRFRRIVTLNCNGIEDDIVIDTSDFITITVYSQSVGGTITPETTDVCLGDNSTLLTLDNHLGNIEKWQFRESGTNDWTDILNTTTEHTADDLTVNTQYRAVVKNEICDPANSATATIDVVQPPTAYAGLDAAICENQTFKCEGTATDWSALLWETRGDGSFTNASLINPSYSPGFNDKLNGSVVLVFSASPLSPCSDEAKDSLLLTFQPLPSIEMALHDTICPGDTLFLNPVITGQYQDVIWYHDGSGSFTNPIVTPTGYASSMSDAGETILITIKVFADGLCAGTTIEKELYVYVYPHTTIEIEGETTVCANERGVTYTMEQEGFFNLLWKVEHGDITGPTNTNEITVNWHNLPGQTGIITLQATNQATQCKSSTIHLINFRQASAIDPPEIIGKPISNPVVLICNMYGIDTDGFSYKWHRNDALIPGADQQFYYPINQTGAQPGSADFHVMVTTNENCITKSETFGLELKKSEEFPNNQFFRIYPNPANNELNFELLPFLYITGPAKYIVRIHDLSGRTVHQETMNTDANRITGLDLPAGIYMVTLTTGGFRGIQKLVIIN